MNYSISITIPCFNEQHNIVNTVSECIKAVSIVNLDYEIIIIDDCSSDESCMLIAKNFSNNANIRFYKNQKNLGLAKTLIKGFNLSKKEFLTWVPGDNNHPHVGLALTYSKIKKNYDLVIPFHLNINNRKVFRVYLSNIYTMIVNFLSSNNVRYYNGLIVYNRRFFIEKKTTIMANFNMSFLAGMLILILHKTSNYIEVPVMISEDKNSKSTSLNLINVLKTLNFFIFLVKNAKFFK
jgi:glycosyltransferase involved in cell wall biosynthesis